MRRDGSDYILKLFMKFIKIIRVYFLFKFFTETACHICLKRLLAGACTAFCPSTRKPSPRPVAASLYDSRRARYGARQRKMFEMKSARVKMHDK